MEKQKDKKQKDEFLYNYPPELDCEEFREVWADWISHRKEIRHPLTPTTVRLQFNKLKKMGVQPAIKSLMTSIENGWIGIFPQREEKPFGWREAVEIEQQGGAEWRTRTS